MQELPIGTPPALLHFMLMLASGVFLPNQVAIVVNSTYKVPHILLKVRRFTKGAMRIILVVCDIKPRRMIIMASMVIVNAQPIQR